MRMKLLFLLPFSCNALARTPSLPLSLPWDGRMRERTVGELDKPHTLRPRDVGRAADGTRETGPPSLLPFPSSLTKK